LQKEGEFRLRIAVVVPCYNEEITVGKVVRDFRKALPDAEIYVFDNCSRDRTAEVARAAGAAVIHSPLQGKGHVVRHAFRVIDADCLVMVDGDDTYPAEDCPRLIEPVVKDGFDMVVGTRLQVHDGGAFRRFHLFGNHMLSKLVSLLFGQKITDMLSGYRVFSRNFVERVPLHSKGFEIETDLTLQTVSKGFSVREIPVSYRARPKGSHSKLSTFSDGALILRFIFRLIKDEKPLPFFTLLAFFCFGFGLVSGWAPIMDYLEHSYVYKVPRAILAASLMLLSAVLFGVGLILDSQVRYFQLQHTLLSHLRSDLRRERQSRAAESSTNTDKKTAA
jgi:glycosyltransferase involved in cell wall biosynthesis